MDNTKNSNKRQVYIHPDNLDFWDNLKNKSGLINKLLRKYREESEN